MDAVLSLKFEVPDDRPDWPVVTIRVNGSNPFAGVADEWQGFDPAEILGADAPLVPDDAGRRVAVYRCSCGEPGCGVIAPYIVPSPDHQRISWIDFRDYTGVFNGPLTATPTEGRPWNLPDLHFNRTQYLAEVRRATADRSWETPRRATARLLKDRLRSIPHLRWISPAWNADGVQLSIEQPGHPQQLLHLTSTKPTPEQAASDMAHQLLSTPPTTWPDKFRAII
ncbi:hypothetical protein [Kribbella sp.]|uniref:hypothetical protein n=1 Tax=Kribbella sp. TaxID=1871183 RepID=UPI002D3C139A|nr:hypothetical protein [Kribbella sp.]HZX09179.1 hypothetical protein [Kribbella sp.]